MDKPDWKARARLRYALKAEWTKYRDCPVVRDMSPTYNTAQLWGFVVAAYFLIEQGIKALLLENGRPAQRIHVLSSLYGELPEKCRKMLSEYHKDLLATFKFDRPFPFATPDEFLANLDGGNSKGSLDWRYSLIESDHLTEMPGISINVMHELAYGCLMVLVGCVKEDFDPMRRTHSWRLRDRRADKYQTWLTKRMNSDGWSSLPDRIELLWGPDHKGRHDYYLYRGRSTQVYFAALPDEGSTDLHMFDMRSELEEFDPSKLTGWLRQLHHDRKMPSHGHVMF